MLARLGATDFAVIRDALEVSDPTLSKHLKQLEQVGYLALHR
ncbi:transcriptional regulator [Brachybacterium paraconglomeratum]|nr:transcriptional regulator [Brachybacterium paraconglomeratum]MCZ4328179.1 transcriptional regulator [Brachybacterium paraconglomeratum]